MPRPRRRYDGARNTQSRFPRAARFARLSSAETLSRKRTVPGWDPAASPRGQPHSATRAELYVWQTDCFNGEPRRKATERWANSPREDGADGAVRPWRLATVLRRPARTIAENKPWICRTGVEAERAGEGVCGRGRSVRKALGGQMGLLLKHRDWHTRDETSCVVPCDLPPAARGRPPTPCWN